MKDKRLILLALVPAALGGLVALLLSAGWLPNPLQRLVVFGDRAGLLLMAGVLLSTVLAIGMLGLWLGGVWGWRRGTANRMSLTEDWREFYGRLDHELKNPLQALYTSLENIRKGDLYHHLWAVQPGGHTRDVREPGERGPLPAANGQTGAVRSLCCFNPPPAPRERGKKTMTTPFWPLVDGR